MRGCWSRALERARRRMATLGTGMVSVIVLAEGCPFLPVDTEFPVHEVVVTAQQSDVAVGGTLEIAAVVTDVYGNVLDDRAVAWSSSDPAVATVQANGGTGAVVTGVAEGSVSVRATAEEKSGALGLAVVPPSTPAAVASVEVSLVQADLELGETTEATATLKDADGNTLTDRAVTWSSADPAVATATPNGGTAATVAAVAAGSAEILAAAEGMTGRSTVRVSDPGTGGGTSLVNECASAEPEWIWCDDFEQNRLSSYFEYSEKSGSFVRSSDVGAEGSYGMRVRFALGQVDAGNLKLAFGRTPSTYFRAVDAGTANYREVYWRMYVRNEPAWVGGGGRKLSRATVLATSNWAQAMIAHVWSGTTDPTVLTLDPASGTDESGNLVTTQYNDFDNLRWLGIVRGTTPLFGLTEVGKWHCVEARVRLNDAGQSNGVFEMWVDGALDARKTGLNWLGAYDAYGINAVFFENYWNEGSPATQERYFDNLVVSTRPIGC